MVRVVFLLLLVNCAAGLRDAVPGNWTSCAVTDDDDDTCQVPLSAAPLADKCDVVTSCCMLGDGGTVLFNYYESHYCNFPQSLRWLSAVLLFGWLIVVFSLLASTADNYFVVQLETLSAELKLSPTVAGITLLALGNSAPDVFADLAAVQNAGDFALALGELMGAAMFLTTIVLAAVIITSTGGICPGRKAREAEIAAARHAGELIVSEAGNTPGGASDSLSGGEATAFTASGGGGTSQGKGAMLKTVLIGTSSCDVDAVPFLRDVGIFFVALLAIFLMIAIPDEDGKHTVTLLESVILILVYVVYVVVVSVSFLYRCYNLHCMRIRILLSEVLTM